jgi:catechol 2,3-dioxygenase-like lactoylglutathione lyase family enzyme
MREPPEIHSAAADVFRDPQVNLYVSDIEASLRFYGDGLGFEETFRTPREGSPIHIELRLGGLVLGVATVESARAIHHVAVDLPRGAPRSEVVVWTDDVDAAFAHLTSQGASPLSEPHDFLSNLRAAWVADPDGNPVQLVMRCNTV